MRLHACAEASAGRRRLSDFSRGLSSPRRGGAKTVRIISRILDQKVKNVSPLDPPEFNFVLAMGSVKIIPLYPGEARTFDAYAGRCPEALRDCSLKGVPLWNR